MGVTEERRTKESDETEVARFSSPRDNTQNSKTKQSGETEGTATSPRQVILQTNKGQHENVNTNPNADG